LRDGIDRTSSIDNVAERIACHCSGQFIRGDSNASNVYKVPTGTRASVKNQVQWELQKILWWQTQQMERRENILYKRLGMRVGGRGPWWLTTSESDCRNYQPGAFLPKKSSFPDVFYSLFSSSICFTPTLYNPLINCPTLPLPFS
jgi:hypothetical protein